jgi:enoyl-CoA hydratase/carnithine racemase
MAESRTHDPESLQRYDTLLIDRDGPVEWLTLNRPESLNAITTQMVTELRDYFGRLAEDDSVRIVVMRGAGRAFCAGLDIKASREGDHAGDRAPFGYGFGFQGYLADVP